MNLRSSPSIARMALLTIAFSLAAVAQAATPANIDPWVLETVRVENHFAERDEDHALAAEIAGEFGVAARYIKADMSKPDECRALLKDFLFSNNPAT